jgi:PAS domain S-box-containing protein
MLRLVIGFFSVLSAFLAWRAMPRLLGDGRSGRQELGDTKDRLLKTLDEFNKLYHEAPCGYHSIDRNGTIIAMNATELNWLGYDGDEVIEKLGFKDIITEDSGKLFEQMLPTLIRTGYVTELEFEMVRKDGSTFTALFNATAIKNDKGEYTMSRCTVFDITTRKKSEESLRESQEVTRSILESANDAFIAVDHNGKISDWNRQAEKTFGYNRAEALGLDLSEALIPPQHREALERGMQRFLISGQTALLEQRLEIAGIHKNGTEFPIEVSIFPINRGNQVQFCAFIHDITDRKQAEEAVRVARDQAIDASKFKSEFLANMSHEIRTPMNGILGMTEMLTRTKLTEKQSSYANTINEAARSLLSVINDILDFSKIEAGKLNIEMSECEPIKLVESVAELLAGQAKKKKLSLLTFVDPKIPHVLRSDPGRLRQILMNFAGNAIKFSDHGEVCIRAALEGDTEKTVRVKFSVSDSGIGMTDDEMHKLFQPFVQVDGSITRKYGGTGLGLSISKRLTELLDGEIGVSSTKGEGSTFWISVPLEKAQNAPHQRPATAKEMKQMRVLVVDDEENSRDILHQYILSWGMRNGRARNADEALEILREHADTDPYSIALIDLFMTGTNGLQLGKIIREDDKLKDMRLILVTAFDNPGAGEEAIAHGFDGYLTKPVKQSQLLDCITTVARGLSSIGPHEPMHAPSSGTGDDEERAVEKRHESILVVEDHYINQEVAQLLLKDLGFEAEIAENGRVAVELVGKKNFDLIFMDCQMPELDGYGATNAIRKMETRTGKRTPIVAMTAHAMEGSREECLAAGMDDYVSKPIEAKALENVLDKWLPKGGRQQEELTDDSKTFKELTDSGYTHKEEENQGKEPQKEAQPKTESVFAKPIAPRPLAKPIDSGDFSKLPDFKTPDRPSSEVHIPKPIDSGNFARLPEFATSAESNPAEIHMAKPIDSGNFARLPEFTAPPESKPAEIHMPKPVETGSFATLPPVETGTFANPKQAESSTPIRPERDDALVPEPAPAKSDESNAPPMDLETLSKRYGAKHQKLIDAFLRDAPAHIANITAQGASQSSEELLKAAHSLKGISGTVFAVPMRMSCMEIESATRDKKWVRVNELIAQLTTQFDQLKDYVESRKQG